ncbi:MAG: RluA family pseudouridine synthase [Polyangiaceae bacterium]|nr:RluA family pseudouridine synthase [Polyangiaceae bacterium]
MNGRGGGPAAPRRFRVPVSFDRARLDQTLVGLWRAEGGGEVPSRGEVQRWVDAGRVLVDGRAAAKAGERVRVGAELSADPLPPPPSDALPDPTVPFRVVFEDEWLLIVDKPAGVVVHPSRGHPDGTLVNGLLALNTPLAPDDERDRGPEKLPRPGIVHRLDKGTSGLMVVAKQPRAREGLKALFAAHDIERSYVALALGATASQTVSRLHARHPTERLRFTSRLATGKRAVTHLEALASLAGGKATIVRCRLETGRTHQIRVHLAEAAGTPVLGDPLYGRPPADLSLRRLAETLGHQALHAEVLGFVHPVTKQPLRWVSPLPPELAAVLRALGGEVPAPPAAPAPPALPAVAPPVRSKARAQHK